MSIIRLAQIVEATTGGVARHVIDLVSHLDPEEFHCTLLLSLQRADSWRDEFAHLAEQGFTLHEIPMVKVPDGNSVDLIKKILQQESIELVHLHSAKAGYHGRLACRKLNLPIIYTPHAFPFQRTSDLLRPLYRYIERKLLADTTRIICVSPGENALALQAGFPAEKLQVIRNGIDLAKWPLIDATSRRSARAKFNISERETVVGVLARLEAQKGIDILLRSLPALLADFPAVRVLIWGEGSQRAQLLKMTRRCPAGRVSLLGATSNARECYRAMDIYCAPSRWEAGPYAIMEAMACGLPIIASQVVGHTDCLEHNHSALLVPAGDTAQLREALRTILTDLPLCQSLGASARAAIEQQGDLADMVEETAQLYRQLIIERRWKQAEFQRRNLFAAIFTDYSCCALLRCTKFICKLETRFLISRTS